MAISEQFAHIGNTFYGVITSLNIDCSIRPSRQARPNTGPWPGGARTRGPPPQPTAPSHPGESKVEIRDRFE